MTALATISASRIILWNTCRLAYRYEHIDKFPDPPHVKTAVGSAVHEALADVGRLATSRKVATIPTEEAVSLVRSSRLPVLNEARELMREVAPALDFSNALPEGIEEEFSFELEPGRVAHGRTDLVRRDNDWNTVTIDDWKTTQLIGGPLEEDPQAILYLAGEHARYEGEAPRIVFRRVYLRHGYTTPGLMWSPDVDARARELCSSTLDEIEAETEFAPNPSPACKRCAFVDRCPAWASPETLPPDLARPLDELVAFAVHARTAARVFARRAKAADALLSVVLEMAGPFEAAGREVSLKTTKGRRSSKVNPRAVARALGIPEDAISATAWGAVTAALKGRTKQERAQAWAAIDALAPRKPSQRVLIGALADEDEEDDEADESAEEAA